MKSQPPPQASAPAAPLSTAAATAAREKPLPLWTKILLTAFCLVLVPYYLQTYGPTNFLYFCDVALLMTLTAVWTESALLASMAAVGILIPQLFWQVDFLAGLLGTPLTGMTDYMFDGNIPLFARGLSFFHFWLPLVLIWLVWRLGYDRRALIAWTLLAWILQLICFFAMPAPAVGPEVDPNLPVNINYVYGFSSEAQQTWMPALAFLAVMMIGLPLAVYLPTHALLHKWKGRPSAPSS